MRVFICILSISLALTTTAEQARASHVASVDLYYEYIGDSTGIADQYSVELVLYRNTNGAGMGPTAMVDWWSACGDTGFLVLNRYTPAGMTANPNGSVAIPNFAECVDTNAASYELLEAHHYNATVVLSTPCVYTFVYSTCCRPNNITNLVNPSGKLIYVESKLDNTLGTNSAPKLIHPAAKAFCIGKRMIWPQSSTEKDGDSVHYELAQPLSGPNQPIAWETGYNVYRPITANSIHFNQNNGYFAFTPTTFETGVIKVLISEYRTGPAGPQLVGTTARDVLYTTTTSCVKPNGEPNIPRPSFAEVSKEISCGEKQIVLNTSTRIDCESIAPDASDFAIFNSLGNLLPVTGAVPKNCSGGFTEQIVLNLHGSFWYNDTLYLVSRLGNDLTTLVSSCGIEMSEDDSLQIRVSTCTTAVDLAENTLPKHQIFPNPVRDELNLVFPASSAGMEIVIFNLRGQVLKRFSAGPTENQVDVSGLQPGLYLIRLNDENTSETLVFEKI